MSVRDFFSNSVLKQSALEFLKNRANFQSLPSKYKRPFRGIFILKNITDLNEKQLLDYQDFSAPKPEEIENIIVPKFI